MRTTDPLSFSAGTQISIIIAQLTAILTGLFGLQRAFSSWQKVKNRFAQLWEARANLKTEYYGIRTRWYGKISPEIEEHFLADINQAIAAARIIVRKEQDDFFRKLSEYESVDALKILKDVQASVAGLLSAGKPPKDIITALEDIKVDEEDAHKTLTDQRKKVARLSAEFDTITTQIEKREKELKQLSGANKEIRKVELESAITELRKARNNKEAEFIVENGALAAITVV